MKTPPGRELLQSKPLLSDDAFKPKELENFPSDSLGFKYLTILVPTKDPKFDLFRSLKC